MYGDSQYNNNAPKRTNNKLDPKPNQTVFRKKKTELKTHFLNQPFHFSMLPVSFFFYWLFYWTCTQALQAEKS